MISRLCIIGFHSMSFIWLWFRNKKKDDRDQSLAIALRVRCEKLGPTFIKLGQMLSMRPDYLPPLFCNELEKLLDSSPPLSSSVIRKKIESQLKKPIAGIFQDFQRKPLASASLSQVHKATLWSGETVVVKVLRPNVESVIRHDIRILRLLTRIIAPCITRIRTSYWLETVDTLYMWLKEEMDYEHEVENMNILRKQYANVQDIHIPFVHTELCTKHILVMDIAQGKSLNEIITLQREGRLGPLSYEIQERMAYLGDQMFVTSLSEGYLHGDVHPANIFLDDDGTFTLIDCGLIQYFDVRLRHMFLLYLLGATFSSPELVVKAIMSIGKIPPDFNEEEFFRAISKICSAYKDRPAHEMSNSTFLVLCLEEFLQRGLEVPWPAIIYIRSTTAFDGMILKLCPEYIFTAHSRPLFLKLYVEQIAKQFCNIPKAISLLDDLSTYLHKVPESLRNFVEAWAR